MLHDVAGKAHEIGRKRIDHFNDGPGVSAIAFVMQIAEVDKAVGRIVIQAQSRNLDPLRLKQPGVCGNRKRRGEQGCNDEFAPGYFHLQLNTLTWIWMRANWSGKWRFWHKSGSFGHKFVRQCNVD